MSDNKKEDRNLDLKATFRNLRLTWKLSKGSRRYLIIYAFLYIILCFLSVAVPIYSAKQILLLNSYSFSPLIKVSLFILGIDLVINILSFFSEIASRLYYKTTLVNIQMNVSKEILKLEVEELDKTGSGVFIDRLGRDADGLSEIFSRLMSTISEILANIGVIGAIFVISKEMFLYFTITIILLFVIERIRIKKMIENDKEYRKIREKNTGFITEMIRGLRDIKVLGSENSFLKNFKEKLDIVTEKRYEASKINRKYRLISNSFRDLINFSTILLGIKLVYDERLSLENFVVVYMYRNRLYGILNYFSFMVEYIKDYNLSCSRVFEITEGDKYKKETFGKVKKDNLNGHFEFKNVCFSYDNKKEIIKDLSFSVKPNETVAFVGRSGAGKTTIFNLLTKLYHPTSGEILIDKININDLTKDSIRRNISIITQNPYVFNLSIKDNLKIVKPNLTNAEMVEACKKASLNEFIDNLPEKYNTIIGEGGVTLSGGQRQRLAIARAFLKESEIILFDEATSALDNETQENISNAIHNLQKTKTILIVAHRLSTIKDADRILVIDNGKIVGEGTHDSLLKNNSLYQKLYKSEIQK